MTQLKINRRASATEIHLASPEQHNVLNDVLTAKFIESLDSLAQDDSTTGVIITGAGGIFSAGGDFETLKVLKQEADDLSNHPALEQKLRNSMQVIEIIRTFPKPVIAAIDGACAGAALGWVAACDIRIASSSALFNTAYVQLGLGTDFGVAWLLSDCLGAGRALDWILRPRKISVGEAHNSGFIGAIYPPEDLLDEAHQIAANLAKLHPDTLAGLREGTRNASHLSLSEALDAEAHQFIKQLPTARTLGGH